MLAPNPTPPENPPPAQPKNNKLALVWPRYKTLLLLGGGFFVLIIIFLIAALLTKPKPAEKPIPSTNPDQQLSKAKSEQEEASAAAAQKATPSYKLQQAYDEVIGAESLKRNLVLDETGKATIEYTIASKDGQAIIKTTFENFADLAVRIFNIQEINYLKVSTYATKFIDSLGQPNAIALTLEITKEKSDQINWAIKKYSYRDYPSTLTSQYYINPGLTKDYKALVGDNN